MLGGVVLGVPLISWSAFVSSVATSVLATDDASPPPMPAAAGGAVGAKANSADAMAVRSVRIGVAASTSAAEATPCQQAKPAYCEARAMSWRSSAKSGAAMSLPAEFASHHKRCSRR